MSGSDIVVLYYNGTNKNNTWGAVDSWCDPNDTTRMVYPDSYYLSKKLEPIEDELSAFYDTHVTKLEELNSNNVMNVRLLKGKNISPAWFKLTGLSDKFGKFKNMWVFRWLKEIPYAIDPYDWNKLKKWKIMNDAISGSWAINYPERQYGYHGINRAYTSSLSDGSGLITNVTASYGFKSRVDYIKLSLVLLVIISIIL